jgi:hypothetical protein
VVAPAEDSHSNFEAPLEIIQRFTHWTPSRAERIVNTQEKDGPTTLISAGRSGQIVRRTSGRVYAWRWSDSWLLTEMKSGDEGIARDDLCLVGGYISPGWRSKSSSYLVSDARLEITIDGAFHEDKL